MEIGQAIIIPQVDGTFSLSITFELAADEFENLPALQLTEKGEKELNEVIGTIEYGITCPVYGDGREGDYNLKTLAQDNYDLTLAMNRVELTKVFTITTDDEITPTDQAVEDIDRIFEDEVIPAFTSSDEAPKLARLPAVEP